MVSEGRLEIKDGIDRAQDDASNEAALAEGPSGTGEVL
jgi:hypothetical protein